jgi:hypothetical protein
MLTYLTRRSTFFGWCRPNLQTIITFPLMSFLLGGIVRHNAKTEAIGTAFDVLDDAGSDELTALEALTPKAPATAAAA